MDGESVLTGLFLAVIAVFWTYGHRTSGVLALVCWTITMLVAASDSSASIGWKTGYLLWGVWVPVLAGTFGVFAGLAEEHRRGKRTAPVSDVSTFGSMAAVLVVLVLISVPAILSDPEAAARVQEERARVQYAIGNPELANIPAVQEASTEHLRKFNAGELSADSAIAAFESWLTRYRKSNPKTVRRAQSELAAAASQRAESHLRSREYAAEERTRDCMEGEYRRAYQAGQTIEQGKENAILECAHLIIP